MARAAHLVLVGLPGAGKSTVGRELARRLHWPFIDLDEQIEAQAGMSVAGIFTSRGEGAFRMLEREATEQLALSGQPAVVAPGGGWITVPGLIELVRPPSKLVWLQVSPPVALQRLGAGVATRPLLAGENPLAVMTDLLASRESYYLQADHAFSVDSMTPSETAEAILVLARRWGRQ